MCVHLLEALAPDGDVEFYQRFTGTGREFELRCAACHAGGGGADVPLRRLCERCCARVQEAGGVFGVLGVEGRPGVRERSPSRVRFVHERVALPTPVPDLATTLQPIGGSPACAFVALTRAGGFVRLDADRGVVEPLCHLSPDARVDLDKPVDLHVSPEGDLAAVANSHGQFGAVVHLTTGRLTMRLARDTYHIAHSRFPLAFFRRGDRTLLVHATAWNRLDISDADNGRRLTAREFVVRPPLRLPDHYLDYFHAGLAVSPDRRWIADNGWVWHPVGVVTSWSLADWIGGNVWESEDGPSKHALCHRSYFWDGPLCWVGDRTLAVWGYGTDDDWLLPAVRLFDVASGEETGWFPGPEKGEMLAAADAGTLLSFSGEQGTSVWDVATGDRLLHALDFRPHAYHPGAKRFVTLFPDGVLQRSTLSAMP